jgi:hypothetical protein
MVIWIQIQTFFSEFKILFLDFNRPDEEDEPSIHPADLSSVEDGYWS